MALLIPVPRETEPATEPATAPAPGLEDLDSVRATETADATDPAELDPDPWAERPDPRPERTPGDVAKVAARRERLFHVQHHAERHLHPKPSGKPDPTAHLSAEDIEAIGLELDALREQVMHSRGARDAAYIRTVIKSQRYLELGSRAVLLFSMFPPAWILGTAGLSLSKIIDNMEVGHNVLHGQWDWMRDPSIHSTTWQWDNVSPPSQWQESHNQTHHTYTNVLGADDDLGYGIFRVDEDQEWTLASLPQSLYSFLNALFFQWGIASYDVRLHDILSGTMPKEEARERLALLRKQILRVAGKDYLLHPLLSGPSFVPTLLANVVANGVRNLWANGVILCGHFPYGVETFATETIDDETRGEWYVRQMMGSANISGGPAIHFLTGNLSHQIEHHIFPDLPSNRLGEIAPQVKDLCERYGLSYVSGPYLVQLASAWAKILALSLPNKTPERSRVATVGLAVKDAIARRRAAKRAAR
ncbi:MAG TPA: acyl-CoA desaturase [Dermatophilaceae bacterium]|nr:acyl-CoA desaturase [Dermatophilaceae bacterium]